MTLCSTVDLAELLAVVSSLTPATVLAAFMTGSAVSLWLREVVHVDILAVLPCDDLVPFDGLDVTEIVVIEDADTALENVSKSRHLQVVHLGQCHDECKLVILYIQFEECSTSDYLKTGQDDLPDIHMADQNISGHLTDVLKEAEVKILVLKPRKLEVTVHVGAVRVSVSEVPVVMVPITGDRHPPIGPNTDFPMAYV